MAVEEAAAVVVDEAVEVMCKLRQGEEEYLGNIMLESGKEGLRCRFAWAASSVEEVAASCDPHRKAVTCRCNPEVRFMLGFSVAPPVLLVSVSCRY
jgi:hypothetical protein